MITFTAFYTGVENLDKYVPLMRTGVQRLAETNPGARYLVLTDRETAPYLEGEFEVDVTAPSGVPLMLQYIAAQAAFEAKALGLTILAAPDCLPNRHFDGSLRHPMCVTVKPTYNKRINNVAYVYDHDLSTWFLRRAMKEVSPSRADWLGDQIAWEVALGKNWRDLGDGISVAKVEDREIHMYPTTTHNCPIKSDGGGKKAHRDAYILHFKGGRKEFMQDYLDIHVYGTKPCHKKWE